MDILQPPKTGATTINAALLITALEPISHHDPGVSGGTNHSVFRRTPVLMPRNGTAERGEEISRAIQKWTNHFTVPQSLVDEWRGAMSPLDFMAAAAIKSFLEMYEERDGAEVRIGILRADTKEQSRLYAQVVGRIQEAAATAKTMREFWRILAQRCGTGSHATRHDATFAVLMGLPQGAVSPLMDTLRGKAAFALADARLWRQREKAQREEYRKRSGEEDPGESAAFDGWSEVDMAAIGSAGAAPIMIPEVSANAFRHHIRDGAVRHMLKIIGAGDGAHQFPPDIERILENGGSLESGSQNSKNDRIELTRRRYPLLDLLGGCLPDTFLGPSELKLRLPVLVCRELRDIGALPEWAVTLPNASVSASDMTTTKSYARHSADRDNGNPMPYGFEALTAGSQIVLPVSFGPFVSELTVGCLVAAIDTWLSDAPYVGGISDSGCGHISGSWKEAIPDAERLKAQYEAYLLENAEELRRRLENGTIDADAIELAKPAAKGKKVTVEESEPV